MSDDTDDVNRLWLLVTGVLLVTMPAFTLLVAYAVLSATQSVILDRVTAVEAVELYLVELLAFAVFGYLLYRLAALSIRKQDASSQLVGDADSPPEQQPTDRAKLD